MRLRRTAKPLVFFYALVAFALACAIPGRTPTPAPSAGPLPPAIVETAPLTGSELTLTSSITFYFNQAMERASVEAALTGEPALSGAFAWTDDATLIFTPANPWPLETELAITLGTGARAANGLTLLEPVTLEYTTAGYLRLTQNLPEANAAEVDPTSAIVASFNYPVVPLGADPATLAPAFTLDPAASGRSEWLNTSTFIFYPDPGLNGGQTYSVQLDAGLRALNQSPLQEAASWTFTTALPAVEHVEVGPDENAFPLDGELLIVFNQPMDVPSVEAGFQLSAANGQQVQGAFSWDEAFTQLTFTPNNLLSRNTQYRITLSGQARGRGGTAIGADFSTAFVTVPDLTVLNSSPTEGGALFFYGESVAFTFSSPPDVEDIADYISLEPAVDFTASLGINRLHVHGNFDAEADYTLIISGSLTDKWGSRLGEDYILHFRTASIEPQLYTNSNIGSGTLYISPDEPAVGALAVNISYTNLAVGSVPLADYFRLEGFDAFQELHNYVAPDARFWRQEISISRNRAHPIALDLIPDGDELAPGVYWVSLDTPEMTAFYRFGEVFFVVASHVQLTYKAGATDVLVWAVDTRTNNPVANEAVSIYAGNGALLVSGRTDSQGIFRSPMPTSPDGYTTTYAVLATPGEDTFSLALSRWWNSISVGYSVNVSPPRTRLYLYTDRPIYQPGQTVYFRAVVRQAYNGRYTLPDMGSLPLTIHGSYGEEIAALDLPLSTFGTANGSFTLSEDALPGYYNLSTTLENVYDSLSFQVAEYRKPEIDLSVTIDPAEILLGQSLSGQVNARFFFDAPAGNADLVWNLFARPTGFYLRGYHVGPLDTYWLEPFFDFGGQSILGDFVDGGTGRTNPEGLYSADLPVEPSIYTQTYTLEVTVQDESGLPVTSRAEALVHPAPFYVGVRPESWAGQAEEAFSFQVQVVDWEKNPAGQLSLTAQFRKVTWTRGPRGRYGFFSYVREYEDIAATDFSTDGEGRASLSFTPPEPGTYQLDVSGGGALTQTLVWVGGPGQAVWPALPDNRLRLTADQESYQPGDTAQIFVPNPFGAGTRALVTVERGIVLSYQVMQVDDASVTLPIPLNDDSAPNVYVSITLLGEDENGDLAFRQGYISLPVQPVAQTLNVELLNEPERASPGEQITVKLRVTDSSGAPVQGEFSLSFVDLAVLALADPNSLQILPAFYGEQPLGIRTGISLAAVAEVPDEQADGLGGGGGGGPEAPPLRDQFEDTAFWNATIVTDANGLAEVIVQLPDNLTTWQVDARGLTADTRVGEAQSQVITTKELLVRPVTPRFFVAGDHMRLAAVVNNNTSGDLDVSIALQTSGFTLDDPATALQNLSVPAQGRGLVTWWGTVQDVEQVEFTFAANAGNLQDLTTTPQGPIPVLRYNAPQAFVTAGVLNEGGERLEIVSLPRSFDPTGGSLSVELAPSLGAAILDGLEVLEETRYECTEQIVSRFLSNLEAYRALQQLGVDAPDLQAHLNTILKSEILALQNRQNFDGGWAWCYGGRSDAYVTAYAIYGLARARESGAPVWDYTMESGVDYLIGYLADPSRYTKPWQLERIAFINYALVQAGSGQPNSVARLYENRNQLNPWAQALLALSLQALNPDDQLGSGILSALQADAIRSASGAHWEDNNPGPQNMSTPIFNTAVLVYALAQTDPASPIIPDAVRYLMAHREAEGGWLSTYSTAWTISALAKVMATTGELGGQFGFSAALNNAAILEGRASENFLSPLAVSLGLDSLLPDLPNALHIRRDPGAGRLYYTAALSVHQPVESVTPLSRGISIARSYYLAGADCAPTCATIQSAPAGALVFARLTLTLPHDVYYLAVEDFIPAGAEVLNTSLKTVPLGMEPLPDFDPHDPFGAGWGWWYFNLPAIRDESISWTADYLPAGTYELTYILVLLQPGDYRVLPARALQLYFPDVQGTSAGTIFIIEP